MPLFSTLFGDSFDKCCEGEVQGVSKVGQHSLLVWYVNDVSVKK